MYILSQDHKQVFDVCLYGNKPMMVNSNKNEIVIPDLDTCKNGELYVFTIGTYANEEEAKAVLEDIFNAFALEHKSYVMPPSKQAVAESPVTEEKNVEVSEEPVVEEPPKKRKYTRRKKGE